MNTSKEIREEVKEYLKRNESLSRNAAARALNVSPSTLDNIVSGMPVSDKTLFEQVKPALAKLLREELSEYVVESNVTFCETSVSRRIMGAIEELRPTGGIGVVTGRASLGKTRSITEYKKMRPDTTILIRVSPKMNYRKLMEKIIEQTDLNINSRNYDDMIDSITDYLRRQRKVLVIDETEYLNTDALETIRRIWDFCENRLTVIMVGLPRLKRNLQGYRQQLEQLYERINLFVSLPELNQKDVALLITKGLNATLDERVLEKIWECSGGLARVAIRLYDRSRKISKKKITIRAVERAQRLLILKTM